MQSWRWVGTGAMCFCVWAGGFACRNQPVLASPSVSAELHQIVEDAADAIASGDSVRLAALIVPGDPVSAQSMVHQFREAARIMDGWSVRTGPYIDRRRGVAWVAFVVHRRRCSAGPDPADDRFVVEFHRIQQSWRIASAGFGIC